MEKREVSRVRKTRPKDSIIYHSKVQRWNKIEFVSDNRRRRSDHRRWTAIAAVKNCHFDSPADGSVTSVGGRGGGVVVNFHVRRFLERITRDVLLGTVPLLLLLLNFLLFGS